MFHSFGSRYADVRLPQQFTCPFCYTPHPLAIAASKRMQRYLQRRTDWRSELSGGKMFGVLVVQNASGQLGFVAAFSGLLAGSAHHRYFVPPIFDYQQPDGYFKTEENRISNINNQIESTKAESGYTGLQERLALMQANAAQTIANAKQEMRLHKQQRDQLRNAGVSAERETELIRQSQFEKAELKRLERKLKSEVEQVATQLTEVEKVIGELQQHRRQMSEHLQQWLFEQYKVMNGNGRQATLLQIFRDARSTMPPAAAGDCAAPKLLQYAFLNNLKRAKCGIIKCTIRHVTASASRYLTTCCKALMLNLIN